MPNVLLQLPAPDRRWIVKFRGDIWGPFPPDFGGWQDAHDLISVRGRSLNGVRLEQTGMAGEATLSGSGKSCADSYLEAVRKRIARWLQMVSREMDSRARVLFPGALSSGKWQIYLLRVRVDDGNRGRAFRRGNALRSRAMGV